MGLQAYIIFNNLTYIKEDYNKFINLKVTGMSYAIVGGARMPGNTFLGFTPVHNLRFQEIILG